MMKTLLLVYLLHLVPYTHGWSIVTSRPVEEPEPRLMDLAEMYSSQDSFRVNDMNMGLTAIKDKKLFSCFVNDFDPLWLPAPSDKKYIIDTQPCEKVNKNTDFNTLKKKAGTKIALMCKDLYVFWLAARNMGPLLLPGVSQEQQSRRCSYYDDDLPIPPPAELVDAENVPSGRSGSPDNHSPSLQENQMSRLSAQPSQMLDEIAPPMLPDNAPPESHDGAPPLLQDVEPPMPQDGAPPMIHDGAPPMIHDGAPPMIHDGAPPIFHEIAPPMSHDGAPPMLQENAPPMFKDGEMQAPPLAQNTHSRRDLDSPKIPETPPQNKLLAALTGGHKPKQLSFSEMFKKVVQESENGIIAPPTPDMKTPPPPQQFRRNI